MDFETPGRLPPTWPGTLSGPLRGLFIVARACGLRMAYAGDEDVPGFPSNDAQLGLVGLM